MKVYFLHCDTYAESNIQKYELQEMKDFFRLKNFDIEEIEAKDTYGNYFIKKYKITKIPSIILTSKTNSDVERYKVISGLVSQQQLKLEVENYVLKN